MKNKKIIDYLLSEGYIFDQQANTYNISESTYTKQLNDFKILVVLDSENEGSGSYIDLEYTIRNNSNVSSKQLYSELYDVFSLDKLTLEELKTKLKKAYSVHFKTYKVEIIFKAVSEEEIDFNKFIEGCIFDLHNNNFIELVKITHNEK